MKPSVLTAVTSFNRSPNNNVANRKSSGIKAKSYISSESTGNITPFRICDKGKKNFLLNFLGKGPLHFNMKIKLRIDLI